MLSNRTKISIDVLVAIASARPARPVTSQALSDRLHVSVSHLESIAAALRQAGLIRAVRGPGGGYVMDCDPANLTVWAVFEKVDHASRRSATWTNSPIASLESSIHATFVEFLSSRTIADYVRTDLVAPPARMPRFTGLRPNPMPRIQRPQAPNSVFELCAFPLLRAA